MGWRDLTGPAVALVVLLGTLLSLRLQGPPILPEGEISPDRFSARRALDHVEALASAPRPPGSPAHDRARAYLLRTLRRLGLEPRVQEEKLMWRRGNVVGTMVVRNVLARVAGSAPTGAVALVAHYDSRRGTPGAADDASGLAAILEVLRAVRGELPLRNDLVVLFTDGEEAGLLGARAFRRHPWMRDVRFVVNLEARGNAGPSLMFETGPPTAWSVKRLRDSGVRAVTSSLFDDVYRRLPNDTDFTVFRGAGIPGLNFAFIEGVEAYHTSLDTPSKLSLRSLQHHGDQTLGLLRSLGSDDLGAPAASTEMRAGAPGRPVFFSVPGLGVMSYGAGWGVLLSALVGIAWLVAVLYGGATGRLGWRELLLGAGAGLLAIGLAAGAGWTGRALLPESPAAYPDSTAALLHTAGAVLVGLAFGAGLFLLLRERVGRAGAVLGGTFWPVFLTVGTGPNTPGLAYLLAWPTAAAVGLVWLILVRGKERDGLAMRTAALVAALPTLALWPPVVRGLVAALGPSAMPAVAAATAVYGLLLLPLLDPLRRPVRGWAPAALFVGGIGLYGAGLVRPEGPEEAPLLYVLDRQHERAWWATARDTGVAWLDGYVPRPSSEAVTLRLPARLAGVGGDRSYRAAPAPARPFDGLRMTVREGARDAAGRARTAWEERPEGTAGGTTTGGGDTGRETLTVYLELPERPTLPVVGLEVRPVEDPSGPLPDLVAVDGRPVPPAAGEEDPWVLRHLGGLTGPTSLELSVPVGGIPRLETTLFLEGLPSGGRASPPRRPGGLAAVGRAGGRPALTELTLVRESLWVRREAAAGR